MLHLALQLCLGCSARQLFCFVLCLRAGGAISAHTHSLTHSDSGNEQFGKDQHFTRSVSELTSAARSLSDVSFPSRFENSEDDDAPRVADLLVELLLATDFTSDDVESSAD